MQHDETNYNQGRILFDTGRYAEAAQPLRAAAEAGNASAQNDYGYLFRAGLGVDQDWQEAERWYRRAAEQGDGDACHNLVNLLLERDGEAAIPEALDWLKVNAAQGHALSQLQLAHFLRRGTGTAPDLNEALRLFRASADQGNDDARHMHSMATRYGAVDHRGPYPAREVVTARAEGGDAAAMRLLGAYCMLGYGGKADSDAAREWIERAAAAGDVPAQRAFGQFVFDEDAEHACRLWQGAAANGDAIASYMLALSLLDGDGIAQDIAKGMQMLESAADKGYVDALVVLGDHHRVGQVVPQDFARALPWYQRAAQQGHAESMWHLGTMLAEGHGCDPDLGLAVHWLENAAKLGWADAQCAIGVHYLQGDGVPKDERVGARWLRAAAEQQHPHGMFVLGMCYRSGLGVPVDIDFALNCWRKAAARGHSQAPGAIEALGGSV